MFMSFKVDFVAHVSSLKSAHFIHNPGLFVNEFSHNLSIYTAFSCFNVLLQSFDKHNASNFKNVVNWPHVLLQIQVVWNITIPIDHYTTTINLG